MPSQRKVRSGRLTPTRRLLVSVEGNIASGKTTFIKKLMSLMSSTDVCEVPEPVEKWRCVGGENLLDLYYSHPERYAYAFQTTALVSRHEAVCSAAKKAPLLLAERSPMSYRLFTKNLNKMGLLSDVEWGAYEQLYYSFTQQIDSLPDVVIYLRTSPQECLARMTKRGRPEESNIDLAYLQRLHEKHEKWLPRIGVDPKCRKCIIVDSNADFREDTAFFEDIIAKLSALLKPRMELVRTEDSRDGSPPCYQILPVSPRLQQLKMNTSYTDLDDSIASVLASTPAM